MKYKKKMLKAALQKRPSDKFLLLTGGALVSLTYTYQAKYPCRSITFKNLNNCIDSCHCHAACHALPCQCQSIANAIVKLKIEIKNYSLSDFKHRG